MSPDNNNNNNPVGSAEDQKARSTTGPKTSSAVLPTVPLKCPICDSPNNNNMFCNLCVYYHSYYVRESSISLAPEVSDAVPPLYINHPNDDDFQMFKFTVRRRPEIFKKVKSTLYDDFPTFDFLKLTPEVSDTVEITNIPPELEYLLGIHTTLVINKFHAEFTGFRYSDNFFDRSNLEKFIRKQFFKTAGIKSYDGVTAKEFAKLLSRYESSLLYDCRNRSQMQLDIAICPMSLKREFSTEYRAIHRFIDQFIEKNGNTIGDEVKLDQYGMPRLRAFITLKFFQMAEESGLMLVMDSTNISDMLRNFEEPLLRDCIQEIQKGPIQKELIKTFAQPESEEEKLIDQRKIKFMQKINLDGAIQGAAIVVSYVLSSSKSRVVQDVLMFALVMGITCSMLAHFLRNKESVSKVLTKLGLMGIASSVILSFAALFPQVIMSCTFGTIAILLLAFTVMMN